MTRWARRLSALAYRELRAEAQDPWRVLPDHAPGAAPLMTGGRTTMSRLLRLLMLLLLAAAPCAVAAEVRPKDQVRLIGRDQHIPVQGIAASICASSVAQKSPSCR